jgi:hypothetical protein
LSIGEAAANLSAVINRRKLSDSAAAEDRNTVSATSETSTSSYENAVPQAPVVMRREVANPTVMARLVHIGANLGPDRE